MIDCQSDYDVEPQDWGVAWFGNDPQGGICQRCERPRPVYRGYNGGQFVGVLMCSSCKGSAVMETREHRRSYRALQQSSDVLESSVSEVRESFRRRRSVRSKVTRSSELTSSDVACLRMMRGARFDSESSLTLPSGKTLLGKDIQDWVLLVSE